MEKPAFPGRGRSLPVTDLVLPLLALAALLFCGEALAETTFERIVRTSEVRVGYAKEPPFAFRAPDGRLTGAGPDVARRIFAMMGIHGIKGVESEFGALIRDLRAGRFDMIAIGLFVLPDRCRQIAFSEPVYKVGSGFAVRPGNPKNLHGFDDIARDPSLRLGVVAGGAERTRAQGSGVAEQQLVIFPDTSAAADGVKTGRVDAYAGMGLTVEMLVQRNPRQIERAEPFHNPVIEGWLVPDHGAYGFRLEDGDLKTAFNRRLAEFLRSPDYLQTIAPFGFTHDELPEKTTAELCAAKPKG